MEKYGRSGQFTDGDITGRRIDAICISDDYDKATNTHSEYVILIAFSTPTMVTRKRLIVT